MPRNRPARGNHVIRTCLLAAFLGGSLFAPRGTAQSAESYRQRAAELSRAKSWDDAITNYRKALELEPNHAITHYNLALALKYKGESRESLKEFQAALKLRAKWAEAHYGIGAVWYDLQDQDDAVKELRTAEALDPLNAATHRLLARILAQQNNLADAEHELRLALKLKPSAESHLEMGVVEGQLGKLNDAVMQFRDAIRLDPSLAGAHLMLGVALRRQADSSGALEQFRLAVKLKPDDPEAQYDLGRELKTAGDIAGAIAAFRRAIELKPDFEQAHYNLALALRAQGDANSAKKEFDELSGLHEFRTRLAQSKLLIVRGVDELKQQKLDEAISLFQKSVELTPELPTSFYYLGVAQEGKNEAIRARAAYEKAIELKPDYAQAHASFGLLLWKSGDQKRGLEEFQQAVMCD
ncbi:MAG: hypothetical protein DMG79_04355, partial [Acidobacteria bacterium]